MAASVIVAGVRIDGKISGASDVKVDGEVYGEITLENSSIFITQSGKSEATIKALNIFIAGTFTGDAQASELIQISPTGRVSGQLKAPYLAIEKGAKFSGTIEMGEGGAAEEGAKENGAAAPAAKSPKAMNMKLVAPKAKTAAPVSNAADDVPEAVEAEAPAKEEAGGGETADPEKTFNVE